MNNNKKKEFEDIEINALKERVKELNCLYHLTKIVKNIKLNYNEALDQIAKLIPPAWQYPDITCARITIDNHDYKTENFKETRWSQVSNIISNNKKIGFL